MTRTDGTVDRQGSPSTATSKSPQADGKSGNKAVPSTAPSIWIRIWRRVQAFIRLLPIVGHLPNCTLKNHKDSFKEFVITLMFGTATFWVTALILAAFSTNVKASPLDLLRLTTSTGQLFIFAVGMLGPILLASAEEPPENKQFPSRATHFAIIILIGALASAFYAMTLIGKDPNSASLVRMDFLFNASVVIAAVVVVMRYLTTVYRKNTASWDAEVRMKLPENEFATAFDARHAVDPLAPAGQSDAQAMVDHFNKKGGSE